MTLCFIPATDRAICSIDNMTTILPKNILLAVEKPSILRSRLDSLYYKYNRRYYVHPDPLEFLYNYKHIKDREIVGLIASSLAYGRVAQILKSVSQVLSIMSPSPYIFLKRSTFKSISKSLKGFTHRFAKGNHLAALLWQTKKIVNRYGSLNNCFLEGFSTNDENVICATQFLTKQLKSGRNDPGHLVAMPNKGSACKRINLFLRWMVRQDEVDPGGWEGISPSKLLVPLDVHMHRIGVKLGLTDRKQANMLTALEVTSGFKKLIPNDPVKYDFALTRFGIRNDMQ